MKDGKNQEGDGDGGAPTFINLCPKEEKENIKKKKKIQETLCTDGLQHLLGGSPKSFSQKFE